MHNVDRAGGDEHAHKQSMLDLLGDLSLDPLQYGVPGGVRDLAPTRIQILRFCRHTDRDSRNYLKGEERKGVTWRDIPGHTGKRNTKVAHLVKVVGVNGGGQHTKFAVENGRLLRGGSRSRIACVYVIHKGMEEAAKRGARHGLRVPREEEGRREDDYLVTLGVQPRDVGAFDLGVQPEHLLFQLKTILTRLGKAGSTLVEVARIAPLCDPPGCMLCVVNCMKCCV